MSDKLIKISKLVSQVHALRILLLLSVLSLLVIVGFISIGSGVTTIFSFGNYVAKIKIAGEIVSDNRRTTLLNQIANNKRITALILEIDSPGGSAFSSEELYNNISHIAKSKPVVAVLQNIAASGGYMTALAADYIVVHNSTITGSIGVIARYVGITDLASKLGITLKSIKSSDLKGAMSPFEKMTPEAEASIKDLINDSYNSFINLVAERRKMNVAEVKKIADGRVYSASKAVDLGLADEIGSEKEALNWLEKRGVDISNVKVLTMAKFSSYMKNRVSNIIGHNGLFLMFSLF